MRAHARVLAQVDDVLRSKNPRWVETMTVTVDVLHRRFLSEVHPVREKTIAVPIRERSRTHLALVKAKH